MADYYRPQGPFDTALYLLKPTESTTKGSMKKTYPDTGEIIHCSFKAYGGTEKNVNGVTVIEDTVIIETWYNPEIKSNCLLAFPDENNNLERYEILNTPENINHRNQFMRFKIRRICGGA